MKFELYFLLISLLAGLLHLDSMVFGQFMVSRPIITGPLIGYFFGSAETGFLVGVILELVYVSLIPVGTKVPNDSTAATIFAVVIMNIKECNGLGIPISILSGFLMGFVYKIIDIQQRFLNSTFLGWVDTAKPELVEKRITLLVHYGILISFLKAVLFYLFTLPIVYFLVKKLCLITANCSIKSGLDVLIYVLPAIGIGITISHFSEK